MKACTKCKAVKPVGEFALRNDAKSGRASQCKPCRMQYHYKNREALLQKKIEYAEKNRDAKRTKDRAMYAANPERFKTKVAIYRAANPEKVNAYLESNRGKHAAKAAAYRAANPEQVRADKAARRARFLGAEGRYTKGDIAELMLLQKGKCAVCRCNIVKKYHVDHIRALSKGGSNKRKNLQLLCPPCNQIKSAKDPVQFMQSRGFLL